VEKLANDFMKSKVIPKMKDPKPYEILGSKVIIKTAGDKINDYRFTYDHLSLSHEDSIENKRLLDSVINISQYPDSIISVTVNVGYKTKYKFGNITTDSIKLGYDREKDKITYWPF
jgi:Na+/phosphate symporter